MTRRRGILALLCFALAPAGVWAAFDYLRNEEAWRLVEAAATAHEHVSYRGRAATNWNQAGSRSPAGHLGRTESSRERTMLVIHDARSGRTRYEWRPGRGVVRRGPSSRGRDPAGFCLAFDALRTNYAARLGDETRYLGRDARIVRLQPRHPGRPTLRLVIDRATSLPLEVTTFRSDGGVYRVAAYRELTVGAQEVVANKRVSTWGTKKSPSGRSAGWSSTPVDPATVRAVAGFDAYAPAYLPAGFQLKECRLSYWGRPTISWLYSDGATAFELRQSPVLTPLAMEAALSERMEPARARRTVRRWLNWRLRRLAQTSGDGESVARRSRRGYHRRYELRAGEVDVRLSSRDDLVPAETARVLRSLRRR